MSAKAQRAHAILAPSKAERWMACPGSALAEEAEDNPSNEWSAEGSVAHFVLYLSLKFGLEPGDFYDRSLSRDGFKIVVDDEMVDELEPLVDYFLDRGGIQYYETRLSLDRWLPGQFGTLDFAAVHLKKFLIEVDDLKYGRGLPVRGEENAQLRIYGLGIWDVVKHLFDKRDWKKVRFRFRIHQPRNDGGGGAETLTYAELMEFGEEVRRAGELALKPNAKRVAGDEQCAYCLAATNGHCRAYDKFQMAKFDAKLDDLDDDEMPELPDPDKLTPKQRATIIRGAAGLRQWLSRIAADHVNECLKGGDGGGLKVVSGRKGRRTWVDQKAAKKFMDRHDVPESKRYKPREMISPTGVESILGKTKKLRDDLDRYVEQSEGKPQLVPESDERPKMESYHERFDDESGDDD